MKSLKSLLIPFIVMVVLVGVAITVIISNSKSNSEPTDTSEQSENVISIGTNLVSSIEVVRQDGSGIGFQGALDDVGNIVWSVLDKYNVDVPLNNDAITSWAYVLTNFMSNGTIGDSSELDLAEYGLSNPDFTIIITQYDGTVNHIFVGHKTVDNNNCYFMVEGNSTVYTVVAAKYTYCEFQLIDFLESASLGIDFANLSTVEFMRTSDSIDLTASCSLYDTGDPHFVAISPFNIDCSPYFISLMEDIVNLEITSYIDIQPDQLADYGLDTPAYNFIFTMNDGRVVNISLSTSIDGYYYGTSNVVDGYFKISDLQIKGLDTQLMILLDSYLVYHTASEMSSITGTYGDESFTFEISTTDSISAEGATAMLNMRNAKIFNSDGRSYAAILYESLITIAVSGVDAEATPAFEPEIEFVYVTNDHKVSTLSFVPRDANSYYAFLDGEYTQFVVPASEIFNDSGEDTYNYGAWTAYELATEAIDNEINGFYDRPAAEEAA